GRRVVGAGVPGDDDVVAVGGGRRAVHRATFDLPAVGVHRLRLAPGAIGEAGGDDVADFVVGPVAVEQHRAACGHRHRRLAAVAGQRVHDLLAAAFQVGGEYR